MNNSELHKLSAILLRTYNEKQTIHSSIFVLFVFCFGVKLNILSLLKKSMVVVT